MASFESLVKDVLPYVPGCPDSLIQTNIRSAAIELCEKSKAFTFDLDPITTISGEYEYEFDQPSGTEVHQILWATYDGNDLDPISPRSLELNYPDWRGRGGNIGVKRTVKYKSAGLSPRKRYGRYGRELDY